MTSAEPTLLERIEARARDLGFQRMGVATLEPGLTHASFDEWLTEGRHGEMRYLQEWPEIRKDPHALEPGMKSALVFLTNYWREREVTERGLRIARYAHGDDYHEELRRRMRAIGAFIHAETGADVAFRPSVDTAPILERDLAHRAGLGWHGKNAMLINPQIGSYTFVSQLYVSIELEANTERVPDRCGTCARCMDACPTGAIVAPGVVDARRCISYLTIELRGPIPRYLRPAVGDHLFGCDICQVVCPWNSKAEQTHDRAFRLRRRYRLFAPEDVLRFPVDWYVGVFRHSAMKRAKRSGLLRNAAVVLGNRKDPASVPILAEVLREGDLALVRGHTAWALGRIGTAQAEQELRLALEREPEPYVLEEIRAALDEIG